MDKDILEYLSARKRARELRKINLDDLEPISEEELAEIEAKMGDCESNFEYSEEDMKKFKRRFHIFMLAAKDLDDESAG